MNRKIRIAILGSRGIPARYGGFETFAEELATRLAADPRFELTVFCPRAGSNDVPREYRSVHLEYVREPAVGPLTTIVYDVQSIAGALNGFDIIYMLGYASSFACFLPALFGKTVWINMDGLEWKRAKWGRIARAYLRAMEFIATTTPALLVADAQAIKDDLERRYRKPLQCTFIPYGVDVPEDPGPSLLPANLEPASFFLIVARIEPENHICEMIEGFLRSGTSKKLVVIGGIGEPRTSYVERVLTYASERVILLGSVYDKDQLTALRRQCSASFHGHLVGGTNPSLLEALAAGNRVVAHDNPFNREVAGHCARYFRAAADIPDIVAALDREPNRQIEIAREASIRRVRQFYSWDFVIERYRQLALDAVAT